MKTFPGILHPLARKQYMAVNLMKSGIATQLAIYGVVANIEPLPCNPVWYLEYAMLAVIYVVEDEQRTTRMPTRTAYLWSRIASCEWCARVCQFVLLSVSLHIKEGHDLPTIALWGIIVFTTIGTLACFGRQCAEYAELKAASSLMILPFIAQLCSIAMFLRFGMCTSIMRSNQWLRELLFCTYTNKSV